MKRYVKTLILLVIAGALFSWYFFYEVKGARQRQEKETAKKKIFPFSKEEITLLEFTGTETTISCQKEGKTWRITRPQPLEGDGEEIGKLIDGLLGLEQQRSLGQVTDLNEFGFSAEKTVTLGTSKEKKTVRFGGENPSGDCYYVLKDGQEVILVSRGSAGDIFTKDVQSLREKRVLALDTSTIVSLEVTRPKSHLAFAKKDSGWFLEKPIQDEADRWAVDDFLRELSTSKAKEFIDSPAGEASYGFQQPAMVVVARESGGGLFTLTVGRKKDESSRYAKSSTRKAVFTVEESLLSKLAEEPDQLRQKSIFTLDSYNVVEVSLKKEGEPLLLKKVKEKNKDVWRAAGFKETELKSEKVSDYLYDLTGLKIKNFFPASSSWLDQHHLKTPAMVVKLTDKDGKTQEVHFGDRTEEAWYGYLPSRQTGFSLAPDAYDKINKSVKDFLPEPPQPSGQKEGKETGRKFFLKNIFRRNR